MRDIVEEVRRFVEEECRKSGNNNAEAFFSHFIPVVNIATKLAGKKGADKEIAILSSWLHDIGSVICGRENHHINSAEIAEKKLKELGYPEERIEKVKHCIFSHRGSQGVKRESVEAEVLAEADAISHFDDFAGLFMAAFVYENLGRKEARESVKNHLKHSFDKLSPEAKEMVKPKFEAAMLLLNG